MAYYAAEALLQSEEIYDGWLARLLTLPPRKPGEAVDIWTREPAKTPDPDPLVDWERATELQRAVVQGDLLAVQNCLARGQDPDAHGPGSWPAIIYAANAQNVVILEALLAAGANPNVVDERGETPLRHLADQMTLPMLLPEDLQDWAYGRLSDDGLALDVLTCMDILVRHGADMHQIAADGQTPMTALKTALSTLIERRPDLREDMRCLEALVAIGLPADLPLGDDGACLLHLAAGSAMSGTLFDAWVNDLAAQGIALDTPDEHGVTPAGWAMGGSQVDRAALLVSLVEQGRLRQSVSPAIRRQRL